MKTLRIAIVTFILFTCFISCKKSINNSISNDNKIEMSGVLEKLGITSYQYGTHFLSGYALKSNTVNLDDYVNKNVTIIGEKISGYPLDGGPEFLNVIQIRSN